MNEYLELNRESSNSAFLDVARLSELIVWY